jgi:hypothetical protein
VVAVVTFVVTLGIIRMYAMDDLGFAVVIGITFTSPFIGVWSGT